MPVTPTGSISLPLDNLKTLISEMTTWQTWVGVAAGTEVEQIAEAAESIYLISLETPTVSNRPFIVLMPSENWNRQKISHYTYNLGGTIRMLVEANANEELTTDSDIVLDFCNETGALIDQMLSNIGESGYLNIENIQVIVGPERSAREQGEKDDYLQFVFDITYAGI